MEKIDISQIELSLKYGKLISRYKLFILYLGIAISLLIPFATLGIIITILLGGMQFDSNILIALIFANIFIGIVIVIFMFILKKNKKIKNKIENCLYDCQQSIAYARRIDTESINYKPYQIEVSFKFNGKTIKKISSPGNIIEGYRKYLSKYCNKEFKVLYSPKYDDVLILKY